MERHRLKVHQLARYMPEVLLDMSHHIQIEIRSLIVK